MNRPGGPMPPGAGQQGGMPGILEGDDPLTRLNNDLVFAAALLGSMPAGVQQAADIVSKYGVTSDLQAVLDNVVDSTRSSAAYAAIDCGLALLNDAIYTGSATVKSAENMFRAAHGAIYEDIHDQPKDSTVTPISAAGKEERQ